MATEKQYIERVRQQVADFKEPVQFDVEFYKNAMSFALSKLSFDLDASYSTAESVPIEREFLVVKLATIQMCNVRASQALQDGDDGIRSGENATTLAVPDLSITTPDEDSSDVAESWIRLAKALQTEYDGEILHIGGTATAAQIQTGYLNAFSLRNGGLANRRLDPGLAAVTVGAVVTGNDVKLTWSILYHPDFVRYEVRRSTDDFASSDVLIAVVSDNHTVEYTDEDVSAGSYSYRVYTVNPNEIKIPSNTLVVMVS